MPMTENRHRHLGHWLALLLLSLPALALGAEPALILDTAGVQGAQSRGAIIWDVRDDAAFRKGHIPGAVNVGAIGEVLRDPNTEDYLPTAQIAQILGRAGIDPAREVVVYADRGNPYAYFGAVTLRHFGGKQAAAYHDGLDGWTAAGLPLSTEPSGGAPVTLQLTESNGHLVTTAELRALLGNRDIQVVDVRTPDEYHGRDVRALRGGHIPGAVNIPFQKNWVDPETPKKLKAKQVKDNGGMALKSREALKTLYADLDPTRETVVYCQSGVRASETATVLNSLGFDNVKVYDASWLGYANTLDAPAEEEVFVNVGLLNKQLKQLAKRVDELQKQVQALEQTH